MLLNTKQKNKQIKNPRYSELASYWAQIEGGRGKGKLALPKTDSLSFNSL